MSPRGPGYPLEDRLVVGDESRGRALPSSDATVTARSAAGGDIDPFALIVEEADRGEASLRRLIGRLG